MPEAYAAKHYDEIQKASIRRATRDPGTGHMTNPGNKGSSEPAGKSLTPEEMTWFKQLNPYATDEDIKNYLNRSK